MLRTTMLLVALLAAGSAVADEKAKQEPAKRAVKAAKAEAKAADAKPADAKTLAGISILGNQEAPKSLVIVPWKSSELGDGIGVSRALDTRIRAVDKDVFMRELKYYGIRSGNGQ
jgi:hypothetical protein